MTLSFNVDLWEGKRSPANPHRAWLEQALLHLYHTTVYVSINPELPLSNQPPDHSLFLSWGSHDITPTPMWKDWSFIRWVKSALTDGGWHGALLSHRHTQAHTDPTVRHASSCTKPTLYTINHMNPEWRHKSVLLGNPPLHTHPQEGEGGRVRVCVCVCVCVWESETYMPASMLAEKYG